MVTMNNVLEEKEVESILGNVMGASHKYLEDITAYENPTKSKEIG